MEILKNFVVFEGLDGSGTTTQIGILEDFFQKNRSSLPLFYKTFEPTNGSIGKIIRSALRKEIVLAPKTIAMLFAADRNEHIYGPEGIAERCGRGELVVSDRYLPSSLVYQGITCGDGFAELLNRDFPGPELLLFFDIDPEQALGDSCDKFISRFARVEKAALDQGRRLEDMPLDEMEDLYQQVKLEK